MALTINSGPTIVTGNTNPVQNSEPDAGPSLSFQGSGVLDPRVVGSIGAAPGTKVIGLYSASYLASTDAVPVAAGAARLAAAQAPTAATPLVLTTAQGAGASPAIPIVPFGQSAIVGNVISAGVALDFGFTVGNVTAASPTLTVPAGAWRYFYKGQRLLIAGAGASGGNLFTTVLVAPIANALTLTLADNALSTTLGVQIGTAHPTLNSAWPYAIAGATALFDPAQGVCRAVSITGNTGSAANVVTVKGYDAFGQAMSEAISFVGGAATTNGRKAFKFVTSITPATTNAGFTLSVGTTDTVGFNFRTDYWEYIDIFMAGQFVSINTGWTVADATPAATTVTGDVRGTYALQTASNGDGTVANWATSRRLAMFSSLPMYNSINATNLNYATMFGVAQA